MYWVSSCLLVSYLVEDEGYELWFSIYGDLEINIKKISNGKCRISETTEKRIVCR